MNAALVIAGKDLHQRLRDRSALVLGFVAPLVIATVMSLAFGGTQSFHTTIGVLDLDRGPLAAGLLSMLRSPELADVVTVRVEPSEARARADVDAGTIGAAFVLPRGFTTAAHGSGSSGIRVLGSTDQAIARRIGESLAESFAAQVNADHLTTATAVSFGAPPAASAAAAARLRLPLSVTSADTGGRQHTAISYYAPSMGIFFVFFGIGFGARSFWSERRSGTLDRVAASPARPGAVLIGKSLSTLVFGLASLTTMALVTSIAFDANWGPLVAAAGLVVGIVLATAALTALVSTLARTERQADGVASTVTFGLVLLGGNFVFVSAEPPLLRKAALLTPNGWAMRGFVDLQGGASAGAALLPVLAMLIFTAVAGGVAVVLARRAVLP